MAIFVAVSLKNNYFIKKVCTEKGTAEIADIYVETEKKSLMMKTFMSIGKKTRLIDVLLLNTLLMIYHIVWM